MFYSSKGGNYRKLWDSHLVTTPFLPNTMRMKGYIHGVVYRIMTTLSTSPKILYSTILLQSHNYSPIAAQFYDRLFSHLTNQMVK